MQGLIPKSPQYEELVIFLSKFKSRQSIAFKLLIYFVSSGTLLFGLLLMTFLFISQQFANLAVTNSMRGISHEMANSLYINEQNQFQLDDSEIKLKWGFDALYSNLAFRLVDIKKQQAVLYSVPIGTQGYLFNDIAIDIPKHNSLREQDNTRLYRLPITLDGIDYYFDVARSDLLGQLANEAVEPAIADVAQASIFVAFILFLLLNIIAIRLIIKPADLLTKQINDIEPDDLKKRLDVTQVPDELQPIASAMNQALERVEYSFNQQKRFIADAAHELRTPLTILLNRLELKFAPSAEKQNLLQDARYISRIVEQLLDLSRAQNKQNRQHHQVNLAQVVKNTCSMLAPIAIDQNQNLELEDNSHDNMVNIDEGELSVVVKNLLENAIKHGGSAATIKVTINNNQLIIADSGKGIALEHQQQIFERFWRENQSDRSGSGLGLAITKEILDHYHATISVANDDILKGARFSVNFN